MTSDTEYTIRPYERRDRQALRELARALWPQKDAIFDQRWWWWLFEEPPLWLAETRETKTLVGFCGYIPFRLYHQGVEFSAAWFVDFYVLPAHQRKGLGSRLTRAVSDQFPVAATLPVSLRPSDAAAAVFERLGWQPLAVLHRYIFPWSVLPGAQKVLAAGGRVLAGLTCAAAPLLEESAFDERFDRLWLRVRDLLSPVVARDAAALRARYSRQPAHPYILLQCARAGELAGYMILRLCGKNTLAPLRWFRLGIIVDYWADPRDEQTLSAMLIEAKRYLLRHGAQVLICRNTLQGFHRHLIRSGFVYAGTPVIGAALSRLPGGFTFRCRAGNVLPETATWHLTLGDCDSDLAII
jgi:GNAT superfamily N-acetyltransferase